MSFTTCPLCQGRGVIENTHPIIKNTVATGQAVSLLATTCALAALGMDYEILTSETGTPTDIVIIWEQEAYDGAGYDVGTEVYTAIAKVFDVNTLGMMPRIPPKLDKFVVFFESFDAKLVSHPASNDEYIDSPSEYYPPNDATVYENFADKIRDFWKNVPVAEYDKETKTWFIGPHSWKVSQEQYEYF